MDRGPVEVFQDKNKIEIFQAELISCIRIMMSQSDRENRLLTCTRSK